MLVSLRDGVMGSKVEGGGVKGRQRYNFLIFCRVSNAQKKPKNKPPAAAAANRSQLHNHLSRHGSFSFFFFFFFFFPFHLSILLYSLCCIQLFVCVSLTVRCWFSVEVFKSNRHQTPMLDPRKDENDVGFFCPNMCSILI